MFSAAVVHRRWSHLGAGRTSPSRQPRETLGQIRCLSEGDTALLQEAWNDAIKFRDDAMAALRLGYIRLNQRAKAEQLTWTCAREISQRLPKDEPIHDDLRGLQRALSCTHYANLSVFPDQLFPVMPVHRLDEQPTE